MRTNFLFISFFIVEPDENEEKRSSSWLSIFFLFSFLKVWQFNKRVARCLELVRSMLDAYNSESITSLLFDANQ